MKNFQKKKIRACCTDCGVNYLKVNVTVIFVDIEK